MGKTPFNVLPEMPRREQTGNPLESKEGKPNIGMIELFKEPNIDWMGKAKYFYG